MNRDIRTALEIRHLMAKHGTSSLVAAARHGLSLAPTREAEPDESETPPKSSTRRADCASDLAFYDRAAVDESRRRYAWD